MRNVALLFLVSILMGCVTAQEQALYNQRLAYLEQRVSELEAQIKQPDSNRAKKLADLYAQVEELQVKVGRLEGKVQEHDLKLANVSAVQVKPITASTTPSNKNVQPAVQQPNPPTERSMYEQALNAFHKKNYSDSERTFKAFLKKYPDSPLADNALFWLGEIYFLRGDYLKAIEYYQKVLDIYPKGNKVPIAMFRQGKAWEKLGDTTAARILYEKVINKFPNSAEARLARKALEALH